ncbi:MAG: hypothetical protein IID39_08590, partial [Planctomycetes bacterium]|nr:hypothetical protein [Planctomycetota bacterium]
RKVEVHRDFDRVWAFGTPEDPVVVTSPQCTGLVATELFVDRRKGIAKITGPARLSEFSDLRQDPGAADEERRVAIGDVEVRFDEIADFTLDTYLRQRIDPVTDEARIVETEYISSARFVGAVRMRQGDDLIAGDRIEMTFDPPTTAGAFAQHIRTLEAQGGVVMIRGQDRVTCDDLSVRFGLGPDERTRPQIADAVGDVVVTQGTRTITARDRVTIEMIPILKAKAPFDLVAARLEALRRGLDPATVDWDDVRAEYEDKIEYTVGPQRIEAEGDVTVYDPVENLDLRADSLLCTFRDGRNIDTARVVGFEDEPAYVQMGDFSITAGQVDVDGLQQRADVHGPGRLTFSTYQGLDGSRVATPQHVTISWTREMTFRGADNIALFYGQVHVVSTREIRPEPTLLSTLGIARLKAVTQEQSTFDCDELVIDFIDTPPNGDRQRAIDDPNRPPLADKGALAQSLDDRWWIFAPLAKRFHIASPLVGDEPSRRNTFGSPRRKDRLSFNKEPVHLVASRNVVAVFSNTNPQSGRLKNRVRLDADKMSVDLVGQVLSIPVPGTLLIEDYPLATIPSPSRPGAPGAARSQPSPFGFAPSHLPAQTYIAWGESMSFDFGQLRAEFVDDVFLDRRTGTKMKLAGALLRAQKLDPATMSTGGRQTQLRCNRLVAEFAGGSGMAADAPSSLSVADGRSAASLSANDIRQFDASGGVYLTDADLVVHADRIAKFAQSRLLTIFGAEDADAEIYSQTNAFPWFQGPKFTYNFDTGEVQARNLRVRGP